MIKGIKSIATRHFDGDRRKGPRHAYILGQLEKSGCSPKIDRYGNIWVERGSGSKTILFSSHIDVDPHIKKIIFRVRGKGRKKSFYGVLDNAVGCWLNIALARTKLKKGRTIFVFTASEEVEKNNHRIFARSAREIVKELKRRKIRPAMCVAIDVTYPKILEARKRIEWHREHDELFDSEDRTHCYLDGYSTRKSKKLGIYFIRRFNSPRIDMRHFTGHDEAHVYRRIAPSFAFGPVVFGHFDKPKQSMPAAHMRTALRFLKKVLNSYYNVL
jgi:hypothetical protein